MTVHSVAIKHHLLLPWLGEDYAAAYQRRLIVLLGAVPASLWICLAFFSGVGSLPVICIFAMLLAGLVSFYYLASTLAVRFVDTQRHPNRLREEVARCCLSGLALAIFIPEYLGRVHPPMLRSLLLLALSAFLWFALYSLCIVQHRGSPEMEGNVLRSSLAALASLFILMTALAIRKYIVFGYVGQDIAYFGQIMHTSLHGSLFRGNLLQDLLYTTPVTTDFAGHNSPIMFLFLPFYLLAPHPLTLIVLRNLALFACAFPVYRLARLQVSVPAACLWAAAFLLTPAVLLQATFDFYPLTFAALPVLYAILFYVEKNFHLYLLSLLGTLLVREDLVFFVFGLGLIALLHRRSARWAALPLSAAILWAILSFRIILPAALHGATFVTDACFNHLGHTPVAMLRNMVSHPRETLLPHGNLVYLKTLLTSTGIFLAGGSLFSVVSLPFLLINLMAGGGPCITTVISAQYSVVPATLLFAGALRTATSSAQRNRLMQLGRLGLPYAAVAPMLLTTLAAGSLIFSIGQVQANELRRQPWDAEARSIIATLPPDVGIAAPRYMLPHIANRNCLYQTHRLAEYHHPVFQYLILDLDWTHINAAASYEASYRSLLLSAAQDANLQLVYNSRQYRVYRNLSVEGKSCLDQIPSVSGKGEATLP